jgi:hypothetical protein
MRTTLVVFAATSMLVAIAGLGRAEAAPVPAGLSQAKAALNATTEIRSRRKMRRHHVRRHRDVWRKHYARDPFAFLDYPYVGFANPAYRLGLP